VRRHVAGTAGIGIVTPGAAEVAGPLEDDEVVVAALLEPDRGTQSTEARANDADLDVHAPP
jgi:hypothetical protein